MRPYFKEPEKIKRVKAAMAYAKDRADEWEIRIQRLEIELARLEAVRP